MAVKSFRDLVVWQKAFEFINEVYRLSGRFPAEERFALTAQLRKAAISVAGNIAEGSGRFTSRDLLNFLSHARGSIKEAESHLLVAQGIGYLSEGEAARAMQLCDEISRLLHSLRKSIRRCQRKAGS